MQIVQSILRFARDNRGSVSLLSALILPVLLGMSALALEYGGAVLAKAETQRVADLAANAGASAYGRNQNATDATLAAQGVGILNGVARADIGVTLEPSPLVPSAKAVRVTITTQRTLLLARVIDSRESLRVKVTALAATNAATPACIQALDPAGSGVTLSGGTVVTASKCIVASNNTVTTPCGTKITAKTVNYNSAAAPSQCSNILSPDGGAANLVKTNTPDPLAGAAAISLAKARIDAGVTNPTLPAGGNIAFGYDATATRNQAIAVGCTASFASNIWTFTCPTKTSVNLGDLTIAGGITLNFGVGGVATTIYNFSGGIQNGGGSVMRFGSAVYNIAKGITVPGGARTEFEVGTFRIGPAAGGNAITVGGSGILQLGSATTTGGALQVVGNVVTDGGSCLVFGATPYHDVSGNIRVSGALVFGAGIYAIDGYLHLGASAGGSATCLGTIISLQAIDVSIILSGRGVPTGNQACTNQAFCAGAGYNNMVLRAPTSGSFAKLALIGPTTATVHSGASMQAGAAGGQISGAFYFPNGPISLSGGASVGSASSGCLQLIGSTVTLAGGTTAASDCVGAISGSSAAVRLLE